MCEVKFTKNELNFMLAVLRNIPFMEKEKEDVNQSYRSKIIKLLRDLK